MMPQDELFGVESDEKSERKYFKVPKIVGNGVDLSKLQLRINYQNASKIPSGKDMYIVQDATVYNIITSHNFINRQNIHWVKDDASLDVAKSCVYMDSAYVSFVRIPFKYLKAYGNSENIATVKVRAKLASSGDNSLVFYDGNTGLRGISITNTDWEWVSYTYESLTSESELSITIAKNNGVLIDAIAIY